MSSFKVQNRLKIDKGKHLMVSEHTVHAKHPLHWHDFFEIEIVLSGAGKYVVNDVSYDIETKNMFFLTSTDFHYLQVDQVTRVINISFDEEMIDEKDLSLLLFLKAERAYCLEKDEYDRIVGAARLLQHECSINGDCQRSLLHYILKCILRKNTAANRYVGPDLQYRGIKHAIAYIELHFRERITLQSLAAEAGYHPTYFSELFKKVTGETYMDTLNKLRVGYARTLLANDFSVSDACFISGFGSLSNFLTIFKKNCGMSPMAYRIQSRNTSK